MGLDMPLHRAIRQSHRWLSILFTGAVLLNFVVMKWEEVALWVGAFTLLPLMLLLVTGLYLFLLPYLPRRSLP